MLLVGSNALRAYMPVNRIIHDWDIWMSDYEYREFEMRNPQYLVKQTPYSSLYDINGVIVEIKEERQFTLTDKQIWEAAMFNRQPNVVETSWGKCRVPDIQTLYDMKCATLECIPEWKHSFDKKLIEANYSVIPNSSLYQDRLAETKQRVEKSKKNLFGFFHKNAHKETKISTIPEYIVHDRLHEMIADLIGLNIPTYVKTINGDYKTDMNMFNNLSYVLKVSLMAEESLVLALERWFIPQMIENGINYRLIGKFYNNNEAGPTYSLLKHVNIKGLIGEEPGIVQFGRDNFNEIEKVWVKMKVMIKENGGFQKWFYDEIFDLRDKYRKGEKVGIHHG